MSRRPLLLPPSVPRALPALLLLLVAGLSPGAVRAQPAPDAGAAAPALLDVRARREGLGSSYRVRSMRLTLDGVPLGTDGAAALAGGKGAEAILYSGSVRPGVHVMTLEAVLVGRSAVFGYVEGYRLVLRGRVTFDARPGWVVDVGARLHEAKDVTLGWQHRPRQHLEGRPRQLVREVVAEPPALERDSDPEDDARAERAQEEALRQELEAEMRAAIEAPDRTAPDRTAPDAGAPDAGPALATAPEPAPPPAPCTPVTLAFPFASDALDPEARAALSALATCVAERFPDAQLRVVGHADVRGTPAFNLRLGEARARTVAQLLVQAGVQAAHVHTASRGLAEPVCRERTEACHARNRRAEVTVEVEVEAARPPR